MSASNWSSSRRSPSSSEGPAARTCVAWMMPRRRSTSFVIAMRNTAWKFSSGSIRLYQRRTADRSPARCARNCATWRSASSHAGIAAGTSRELVGDIASPCPSEHAFQSRKIRGQELRNPLTRRQRFLLHILDSVHRSHELEALFRREAAAGRRGRILQDDRHAVLPDRTEIIELRDGLAAHCGRRHCHDRSGAERTGLACEISCRV